MANQKNGKNRGETPASRDGFYFDDDLDSVTAGLPTGDEPEEDDVPDLPPEEDNAPPTEGYNSTGIRMIGLNSAHSEQDDEGIDRLQADIENLLRVRHNIKDTNLDDFNIQNMKSIMEKSF